MPGQSNREDSEVRALSALKALEDERIARETQLAAHDEGRVRMARGTAQQIAVTEENLEAKVQRLAAEAEQAVERYTAAEQALALLEGEEVAVAQANLERLMHAAEVAVDEYAAANTQLERATEEAKAAAARPIPLSRDVWPTAPVVAPQDPDIDMAMLAVPETAQPRRGTRKIVGILLALGVIVVAALAIRATLPSGTTTTSSDDTAAPVPAAAPAAAPELTPREKARQEWERQQAAREAADKAKRKRKRTRRPKLIDPNTKVKVNCDPRDPLCGV